MRTEPQQRASRLNGVKLQSPFTPEIGREPSGNPPAKRIRVLLAAAIALAMAALLLPAQEPLPQPAAVPGSGLASSLFALREMDLHYHSGLERPASMKEWLDLAVADGRKIVLLMDHLELYRKTAPEYATWLTEHPKFVARYPMGPEGHNALFADFTAAMRTRQDLIVFRGWEVYEGELDTGVDPDALRLADALGWHISPNNGRAAPDGKALIHRARQLVALQKRFPVPMILLHPFPMRAENLERTAIREKRSADSLSVAEWRFFKDEEEQRTLASILRGQSVYVEIGSGSERCFRQPKCREAMIQDVRPLAAMGVQFTISTDAHNLGDAKGPFRPEVYAEALGVTPGNANTIVRELLAIRAKAQLTATTRTGAP